MLDTYTFNLTNAVIILISAGVFYTLFIGINRDDKNKFDLMKFCLSIFLGFLVSFGISYITLPQDKIMTSNFWD